MYVPHGWIATPRTTTQISQSVRAIGATGFNTQIHNLGSLDAAGSMAAEEFSGLSAWVATSRAVEPGQRIIAWISGSESLHVDRPRTYDSIAGVVARLVEESGVDGVLLDLEPFSADNPNLLSLLERVRSQSPNAWVGIDAPADGWSQRFITSVGCLVDAVSPMLYDTRVGDTAAYAALARGSIDRYARALTGSTLLVPSLPAYAASSIHDPSVENIATAMSGIQDAARSGSRIEGAAVYWWWEMTAEDRAAWKLTTG